MKNHKKTNLQEDKLKDLTKEQLIAIINDVTNKSPSFKQEIEESVNKNKTNFKNENSHSEYCLLWDEAEEIISKFNEYGGGPEDEDEQIAGWECIFDDNIATPCKCRIGKEEAILSEIRQDEHSPFILGIIEINKKKIRTPIEDLFLEDSESMAYIDAYKYWRENG